MTGLSEVSNPVVSNTDWTKAVDFSGGNEHYAQPNNGSPIVYTPLRMGEISSTVASGNPGQTANDGNARPWACAIVFKSNGYTSNQHLWNQGEGTGTNDDNIYVRQASDGYMYFGWGRGDALNECRIGEGFNTLTQQWFGLYVAHNGTRLSGNNATSANLADCFDIRFMRRNVNNNNEWEILTGGYANGVGNRSTTNNWNAGSTGGRMDRQFQGAFTIGGRGSNRNWHGKVASCVVTTLRRNVDMPTTAEIEMMITDPTGWLNDYKVGNSFRSPHLSTDTAGFALNNYLSDYATQVWLMGDGTNDAYSRLRNQVRPSNYVYTTLEGQSLVSNDIETVTIPGLS
jgi:hypothetical protein